MGKRHIPSLLVVHCPGQQLFYIDFEPKNIQTPTVGVLAWAVAALQARLYGKMPPPPPFGAIHVPSKNHPHFCWVENHDLYFGFFDCELKKCFPVPTPCSLARWSGISTCAFYAVFSHS